MKKNCLSVIYVLISCIAFSQSYNTELNTLGQYVQRMYMNEPFEGALKYLHTVN